MVKLIKNFGHWLRKVFVLFVILSLLISYYFNSVCGNVVLVGGGFIPNEIFQWTINHKPHGKFLLITQHGAISYKWQYLMDHNQNIDMISPKELSISSLNGVGAILLDGGSQYEYIINLDAQVLQKAHERGILILGTSAGAMILSSSYFSAKNGSITSEEAVNGENVCIGKNFVVFNSLKNIIIDTHYTERDRQGRLKVFVEKSNSFYGIGIDESTALCIKNGECIKNKTFGKIIGKGLVHIVKNDILNR